MRQREYALFAGLGMGELARVVSKRKVFSWIKGPGYVSKWKFIRFAGDLSFAVRGFYCRRGEGRKSGIMKLVRSKRDNSLGLG